MLKNDHTYTKDETDLITFKNFLHINTDKKVFEFLDSVNEKWLSVPYTIRSTDISLESINKYLIDGDIPGGFSVNRDGDDTYINDGGSDVYDGANRIKINDTTLYYNTAIFNDSALMVFKLADITNISFSGDTGADSRGDVSVDDRTININGIDASYCSKHIYNGRGSDPTINHLVISYNPPDDHSYSTDTNNDYDEYTWDTSEDLVYLIIYWCTDTTDTTCLTDDIIRSWF